MIVDIELKIENEDLEIGKKLGEGSFGNVFEAKWRKTPVAFKKCYVEKDPLFEKEIITLSKLHHPNIIQLLGVIYDECTYGVVIELMNDSILHMNGLNTTHQRACEIALDISRGLTYLHNRKPQALIHRDLKPSNILLTLSGKVKIADFGLSCFRQTSSEMYKMTGNTGSYRYMAPEIMLDKEYNSSVDMYSFGMVFYGLLENIPFWECSNEQIKKHAITNKRPTFCSKTPKILKDIITKCWDCNPNVRLTGYQTIDQLEMYKPSQAISKYNCFQ